MAYSCNNYVRSSIVNYRQSISELVHENVECNCGSYPVKFTDVKHGHIYTSDMGIVSNVHLRNLLNRVLRYHEQQLPNREMLSTQLKQVRIHIFHLFLVCFILMFHLLWHGKLKY